MKILCLDPNDELFAALTHFVSFFKLDYTLEKISGSLEKPTPADEPAICIIVAHNHTPEMLKTLGRFQTLKREAWAAGSISLLLSEPLAEATSDYYSEEEFCARVPLPFDSWPFFKALDLAKAETKERAPLLIKRAMLQTALKREDYKKAISIIKDIEAEYPSPYHINLLKGKAYLSSGVGRGAQQAFQDALKIRPNAFEANTLSAKAFLLNGDKDSMMRILQKITKQVEMQVTNLIHWGSVALDRGEGHRALSTFELALEAEPENKKAKDGLLAAAILEGKKELVTSMTQGIHNGSEIGQLCNLRGIAMVNEGNFADAEKLYKNAMNFLSEGAEVYKLWFNLGLCLKKKGDSEKAVKYFKQSAEIAPLHFTRAHEQIKALGGGPNPKAPAGTGAKKRLT